MGHKAMDQRVDHATLYPDLVEGAAPRLLRWYAAERRRLPWRAEPGALEDPYRVWLSEVMLQQTTVKAALPYFERFVSRWPGVEDLAAAEREEVLAAWAGLGYYSRANNLHRCAQLIVREHGGAFPQTEAELARLPGIGPYTAAAIAAMAFGVNATPVDGNVERVMARLFARREPLPDVKPTLKQDALALTPTRHAGDFAQALMDLGATVCTPKSPSCLICPLETLCHAKAAGLAAQLPARRAKARKPLRTGVAFVALREDGCVLLRQRPAGGLLSRMLEVPGTPWATGQGPDVPSALKTPPVRGQWWQVPAPVTHVFTHFSLELTVLRALVPRDASLTLWADQDRCRWTPREALSAAALPSVMRKAIAAALAGDN